MNFSFWNARTFRFADYIYGYDIVETFLSIVRRLQAVLNDLKTKLQIHSFYKIYRIETQCPDGSNDVIRNYIK